MPKRGIAAHGCGQELSLLVQFLLRVLFAQNPRTYSFPAILGRTFKHSSRNMWHGCRKTEHTGYYKNAQKAVFSKR